MSVSAIREITIGVGHLRRQVSLYGSAFGLRVTAKGRVPENVCAALWQHDDMLDAVVMSRLDVLRGTRLRLLRTSGLSARPDFDVGVAGPLGIVWGATSPRRTYYRLSGAGVEFHAPPAEDEAAGGSEEQAPALYGRAFDGEYMVIEPVSAGNLPADERASDGMPPDDTDRSAHRGTPSRHFGVTEPIAVSIVTSQLTSYASFLQIAFGWSRLDGGRCDDPDTLHAMGLEPAQAHEFAGFGRADDPGAWLVLRDFGRTSAPAVQPPLRGVAALRVDCDDLDQVLDTARNAGARHVGGPVEIDDPALGRGRVASILPPFGLLVELWEPAVP